MITPSTISKKAAVQEVPPSVYNFPEQIRESDEKTPLIAGYYTWNSMQTYNFSGYPSDTSGDNWD